MSSSRVDFFIKEVCALDRTLDDIEAAELQQYCNSWMYAARTAAEVRVSVERCGFELVRSEVPLQVEFFPLVAQRLRKTRLGRRHPTLKQLPPLEYADFLFRKPSTVSSELVVDVV